MPAQLVKKQSESIAPSVLPNLDEAVIAALEFFETCTLPALTIQGYRQPLIIGSGNALAMGRVLFRDTNALFANEGEYAHTLKYHPEINIVFVISASGGKHAAGIVRDIRTRDIPVFLLTNTANSPAAKYLEDSQIRVFPKIDEPYTYNVSTYLGMLLASEHDFPEEIKAILLEDIVPKFRDDLQDFDAFYFIIPQKYSMMRKMVLTKFDELFGPYLLARAYTFEQTKHAKTIVPFESELFVSFTFGEEKPQELFGQEGKRLSIALPKNCSAALFFCTLYMLIGKIQSKNEPYFKNNIEAYQKEMQKYWTK